MRARRAAAVIAAATVAALGLGTPAQAAGGDQWYLDGGSGFATVAGRVAWSSTQGYASTWWVSGRSKNEYLYVKVTGLQNNVGVMKAKTRVETPLTKSKPSGSLGSVTGWHSIGYSSWRNTYN
jgi:hypothetical protein